MPLPRVLFVDDERMMLRSIERNVRRRVDMRVCESAHEALEVLQTDTDFAVILSDLRMPVMDGIAFLAAARVLAPRSLRILMTATFSLDADRIAACEDLYRCIEKPMPSTALLEILEDAFAAHARL